MNDRMYAFDEPADLVCPRRQTQGEAELFADLNTLELLALEGLLDGPLLAAETKATARGREGKRFVQMQSSVVAFRPVATSQWLKAGAVVSTSEYLLGLANRRPPDVEVEVDSIVAKHLGQSVQGQSTQATAGADTPSRLSRRLVETVFYELQDRGLRGRELAEEWVATVLEREADLLLAAILDGQQTMVDRTLGVLAADSRKHLEAGRTDMGIGMVRFGSERFAARAAQALSLEQSSASARETKLASVNGRIATAFADQAPEGPAVAAESGDGRSQWWTALVGWSKSLFGEDGVAGPADEGAEFDRMSEDLRDAVTAGLTERIARGLRPMFSEASARLTTLGAGLEQELQPIRRLVERFRERQRVLESEAQDLQRRLRGLVIHADAELRDSIARLVLGEPRDLVESLVLEPRRETLKEFGMVDEADYTRRCEEAAGRHIERVANWDLERLATELHDEAVEHLARHLIPPELDLAYAPGEAPPPHGVVIAVPGGPNSRLGSAVRRLDTRQAVVCASASPELAYGIDVSDVFSAFELAMWEGTYPAYEQMKNEGRGGQFVTDRRLVDLTDSVVTDRRLDEALVGGLACGVVASSQGNSARGTFYLIPPGERRSPQDVPSQELDAVFGNISAGGGRLGTGLPEIRRVLRGNPKLLEAIEGRWKKVWADCSLDDRIRQLNHLETDGRLPNPSLVTVLVALRARLEQQDRRPPGLTPTPTPTRPAVSMPPVGGSEEVDAA